MSTCGWFFLAGFAAGIVCAGLVVIASIFYQWHEARDVVDDDIGGYGV